MKKILFLLMLMTFVTLGLSVGFSETAEEAKVRYEVETQKLIDKGYSAGQLLLDFGFIPPSQMDLNENIKREEFIAVLLKLIGEDNKVAPNKSPTFSDVPNGHPYFQVIERAYELGYVSGIGNGQFGIGQTISNNDILYLLSKIDGSDQSYSYKDHFARASLSYHISEYKEYQPVPKGQVYGWLLIFLERYSHITKAYVYKQMPLSKEDLSAFGEIHRYIVNAPHKFIWEGATLYKNAKTVGTPEASDYYFTSYKRVAEYIRNTERECPIPSLKTSYIAAFVRKIEGLKSDQRYKLQRVGLDIDNLDPTNPDFADLLFYLDKIESLKLEAEQEVSKYEKYLADNDIVIDGHYLLEIAEEKRKAYENFLNGINYDHLIENYKTIGEGEIVAYLKKIAPKYYLYEEMSWSIFELDRYLKKNKNKYPPEYYDRAKELNEFSGRKQMNIMYFRSHYNGYGIDYVSRRDGTIDAVEVTREEYDRQ